MLKVGQKLWMVVSLNRTEEYEVEVVKIGRKWATLSGRYGRVDRVDIETLQVDSGQYTSYKSVYLSRDDYLNEVALNKAWKSLSRFFSNHNNRPAKATVESIKQAKELLGIQDKE